MTLYLKYRPQNLQEIDSKSVRDSLTKILSAKTFPHAFLFAGPKGTGKTSAARILAKVVNCETKGKNVPCGKCEQCISITSGANLDVVEIDAASHRGIDDVRVLRDAVGLSPVKAKKKVYIIDEAHMLTTEASNALLKTLEEPPGHVIFILATTNPEKLISTIKSRTTLINFKKATKDEIVGSLKRVVKGEKIKIDKEGLDIIASSSGGSFRDAIKILEQAWEEKIKLDPPHLKEFIGGRGEFDLEEFMRFLARKDVKNLLSSIETAVEKGTDLENVTKSILERLQEALLAKSGVGDSDIFQLSKEDLISLIEVISISLKSLDVGYVEQLPLEVALVKWCDTENGGDSGESISEADGKAATNGNGNGQAVFKKISDDIWKRVLASVRPLNASIEALLRAATPISYDGKTLTLGVFYRFHKERLEDGHHRRILEEVVGKILNAPTKVVCTLTEPPVKKVADPPTKTVLTEGEDKDIVEIAEEIFGN